MFLHKAASLSDPATCDDCLAFKVEHQVLGYGYNTQSTTTQLAIAVMLLYSILALAHIIHLGVFGISSTAWDSTAEMIALAMNSSPTRHLQNTCAGIIGIRTYQTLVRVLATSTDGSKADHLELVFGDVEQQNMRRLEVNQEYGKIHID